MSIWKQSSTAPKETYSTLDWKGTKAFLRGPHPLSPCSKKAEESFKSWCHDDKNKAFWKPRPDWKDNFWSLTHLKTQWRQFGSKDSVIAPYFFFQFACYVLVTIFIVVITETLISWSNHSVFLTKHTLWLWTVKYRIKNHKHLWIKRLNLSVFGVDIFYKFLIKSRAFMWMWVWNV